jgi:ribosomal-protein-alanine N-acetyltransferase
MTAELRKARPEDAPQVYEVESACSSRPWSEQQLLEEIEFPHAYTCVCETDGKVVGFATMQIAAEFAHINEFGVLPEYRRNGFGRMIMEDLLEKCRESGCTHLSLEVRGSAIPARNLYGSLGFRQEGVRKRFYHEPEEDALVLVKELTEEDL